MTTPDARTVGLAKLRDPFAPNQINQLPKPYNKESPKGNCRECGGYHGLPAVHLDYVGHAALTNRFLDVDPEWSWEPLALGPDGLPALDKLGGMWIKLTILGVTRLGYGDAQGKTGANAIKETIGDALRNAGMRFGAALDLWHKGDLHEASEERGAQPDRVTAVPDAPVDVSDDPAVIRSRIAAVAKERDVPIKQVGDDFASWSQGTKIAAATSEQLLAYLAHITENGIAA